MLELKERVVYKVIDRSLIKAEGAPVDSTLDSCLVKMLLFLMTVIIFRCL